MELLVCGERMDNKILKQICDSNHDKDVIFLLVDNSLSDRMEKNFTEFGSNIIITYVADLNYKTIPILKLSDYIIYQDEEQRRLVEEILGFTIPYTVLYSSCKKNNRQDNKNPISKEKIFLEWHDQTISPKTAELISQKIKFFLKTEGVTLRKKKGVAPEVDSLEDIEVIYGKPLYNKFIFSICYRNLNDKLMRCLKSLGNQSTDYDVGVVLVDDASDEDVTGMAIKILDKISVDYIVVRNRHRKYAAKNFYNVIHALTVNDESYIIELDGDDYLPQYDILAELNEKISCGFMKTVGEMSVRVGDKILNGLFEKEKEAREFQSPYNLSKCSGWYHLRMTKRSILKKVEICFFLERDLKTWLRRMHDISVHARAFELAYPNIANIDKVIYIYDITGNQHDVNESECSNSIIDEWQYGTYLLDEPYLFQMYTPLFEEPAFVEKNIEINELERNDYYGQ